MIVYVIVRNSNTFFILFYSKIHELDGIVQLLLEQPWFRGMFVCVYQIQEQQ